METACGQLQFHSIHDPLPFRLTLQVARFPSPSTQIQTWRVCHATDLPAHASPEWVGTTTRTPATALAAPTNTTTPATTQATRAPASTRQTATQSARTVADLILTVALLIPVAVRNVPTPKAMNTNRNVMRIGCSQSCGVRKIEVSCS